MFHALADPTRRALVDRLLAGPASLSDLAAPLPISLPAVHQHVAVLEQAGLVTSEKQGRTRTCRIEPQAFQRAEDWIVQRRAMWRHRLASLDRHLKET